MNSDNWTRVSREYPCPICEKPDWCLYAGPPDAPTAVICPRIESEKRCGEAGWLHKLRDDDNWNFSRTVRIPASEVPDDSFGRLARRYEDDMEPAFLAQLAKDLGLSTTSLRRLGVGWAKDYEAWSFPMSNANGHVTGIRLRRRDGSKFAVTGSKAGIFLPRDLASPRRLLVCEGPSDTAAMLDLDFEAVGRPSCNGGAALIRELATRMMPQEVICVADSDAPGLRGAEELACGLSLYCPSVRVLVPPNGINDARAWKASGATHDAIVKAINEEETKTVTVVTKGR